MVAGLELLQEAEEPGTTAISKRSCLKVCLGVLEGLGGEDDKGEMVLKGMTSHSVSSEHDDDGGPCGGRPPMSVGLGAGGRAQDE